MVKKNIFLVVVLVLFILSPIALAQCNENGECEDGENCGNCENDCPPICGDEQCDQEPGCDENSDNCPDDCATEFTQCCSDQDNPAFAPQCEEGFVCHGQADDGQDCDYGDSQKGYGSCLLDCSTGDWGNLPYQRKQEGAYPNLNYDIHKPDCERFMPTLDIPTDEEGNPTVTQIARAYCTLTNEQGKIISETIPPEPPPYRYKIISTDQTYGEEIERICGCYPQVGHPDIQLNCISYSLCGNMEYDHYSHQCCDDGPAGYENYVCSKSDEKCCGGICRLNEEPCCIDADNDGYDECSANGISLTVCDTQCDCDDDPNACGADCYPGLDELCDGYDNDCDGGVDTTLIECSATCPLCCPDAEADICCDEECDISSSTSAAGTSVGIMESGQTGSTKKTTPCNNPPIISGDDIGVLYRPLGTQQFNMNKFPDPQNCNMGLIVGDHIKDFQQAEKLSPNIYVLDESSRFNSLKFSFGDDEDTLPEPTTDLKYTPSPAIDDGELPQKRTFWMKVQDKKTKGSAIDNKLSSKKEINAWLCPEGKLSIIKKANLNAKFSLAKVGGGASVTINKFDINMDKGICYPEFDIIIDIPNGNGALMLLLNKKADILNPFDINVKGDFSLIGSVKEVIKEYGLANPLITEINQKVHMKVNRDKSGNFIGKIHTTGDYHYFILGSEKKIDHPQEIPSLTLDEVFNIVEKVYEKISSAKEVLANSEKEKEKIKKIDLESIEQYHYDSYKAAEDAGVPDYDGLWFYTEKTETPNLIEYRYTKPGWFGGTKVPLRIKRRTVTNWGGFPVSKETSWEIFGKLVKKKIEVEGTKYGAVYEHPKLFTGGSRTVESIMKKRNMEGKFIQDGWFIDITANWEAETGIDNEKLLRLQDLSRCCPKIKEKIDILKNKGEIKEKSNSVYFIYESEYGTDLTGFAYQFIPPYTFNEDVTKKFDLSSFENPYYAKKDDSFLDSCDYIVLDEISQEIGPEGGEIILPDEEVEPFDFVGDVKQIFPENAVSELTEFSIKRLGIIECSCYNGILDEGEEQIDCGGICEPCVESCYDGIQNQDEIGIDTGGVCEIPFISDIDEPCGWDLNKNGIIQDCTLCEENIDCVGYPCNEYKPICNVLKNCECSRLPLDLSLLSLFSVIEGYSNYEYNLMELLLAINDWVESDQLS